MIKDCTILGIDPGTNLLGFGIIRVIGGKPQFVDMGVLDLRRVDNIYDKLLIIFDKVSALCELHKPDDLAIESPFYGRNAQVIFKLGRAQGAAMTAALQHGAAVYEYAPRKAKQAICGNGAASKEQVALIAMCHFYEQSSPLAGKASGSSWEKFLAANPDRIK